ncbi:MAG: cytochrome c biogenesis CcdA family protein [Angustibacter sp.]
MDTATLLLAVAAGAVATFNPCGFALLPAYLTMLVAAPQQTGTPSRAGTDPVWQALRFTSGMTVGFVAVFGTVALLVIPFAGAFQRWLPVLTVTLGVGLLAVGIAMLAGRPLRVPRWLDVPGALRRSGRIGGAPTQTWTSHIGYGVAFATTSLSCTIGPFLAVTSGAVREGAPWAVGATFVAYALGMGSIVGVLSLAVAGARTAVVQRIRRAGLFITRCSAVLVLVAGAYVAWYGWYELRVLSGDTTSDPVVTAAVNVQSRLVELVDRLGVPGALTAATVVGLAAVVALRRRHRLAQREPSIRVNSP